MKRGHEFQRQQLFWRVPNKFSAQRRKGAKPQRIPIPGGFHGMVWHGMVWHGMVWHSTTWHGMAFLAFFAFLLLCVFALKMGPEHRFGSGYARLGARARARHQIRDPLWRVESVELVAASFKRRSKAMNSIRGASWCNAAATPAGT